MAAHEKYKFKIENESYEWSNQFITGAEVRGLGPGIPDSMDLYMKVAGQPGRLVGADDPIDLRQRGIEKFYAQDASSEAGNHNATVVQF
ncbi:multiubiquitin domain-containing protein [Mesorhizobium sp. M0488]|uniref:multiubiquitin domain-containing protein n=1 Tax=unclassified Mesorhizobium TaxID=325217 RepID=UPI00333A7F59